MVYDSFNNGIQPSWSWDLQRNKKILITGSSGYVGQHLIAALGFLGIIPPEYQERDVDESGTDSWAGDERLCDQKLEIYCAYRSLPTFEDDLMALFGLSSGTTAGGQNANRFKRMHSSVVKIHPIPNIDLSKPDFVELLQQHAGGNYDVIVHLAAMSSISECENNQNTAWKVNCPIELFNFSASIEAPIIFLSSDQVYQGNKSYYVEDLDDTVPVNTYGMTKLGFEMVLQNGERSWKPNPKSVILRSSLILGPPTPFEHGCRKGSSPSYLQFIESRLKEKKSTDYFKNEYRSVVHIDDVIHAIKHFICQVLSSSHYFQSNAIPRVFNLGGSDRISRYDLALYVAKYFKMRSSILKGVNRPPYRGGDDVPSPTDISMDVTKITKELEVKRMMGLEEIVRSSFGDGALPPLYKYASHRIKRTKCHTTFSASHMEALRVKPGELVHVETWDCFGGAYFEPSERQYEDGSIVDESPKPVSDAENVTLRREEMNPVTGPIYVEGAMPGDILSITLHDIRPRTKGVACNGGPGTGQLGHIVRRKCVRFFDIASDRKTVQMQHESKFTQLTVVSKFTPITFPCQPMLGVIGVAPEGHHTIETMAAGKHGGNLDNKMNTIGSTIHIGVNHPGALLSLGDMHANQGDGEICGTGIEVSGDVLLSCSVIKGKKKKVVEPEPIPESDNDVSTITADFDGTDSLGSYGSTFSNNSKGEPTSTDVSRKPRLTRALTTRGLSLKDELRKGSNKSDGSRRGVMRGLTKKQMFMSTRNTAKRYSLESIEDDESEEEKKPVQPQSPQTDGNEYPVTETATHWITHGVAVENIPEATKVASQEAASLLVEQWGFSAEDACIFLGVAGDLGLCQSIHPDRGSVIAKMSVPKIEACPRPYRKKRV